MVFQKEQFELLAPGGDLDSIKAAIAAGADAIYCGLERFNARNRATNITLEVLDSVLALAHQHQVKFFSRLILYYWNMKSLPLSAYFSS